MNDYLMKNFKHFLTTIACVLLPALCHGQTPTDPETFTALTNKWVAGENSRDTGAISSLFYNKIFFYGKVLDRKEVLRLKHVMYKKHADYSVVLAGTIKLTNKGTDMVQADFVKQVTYGGKERRYEAYLTFRKDGGNWAIIEESDKTTDTNLVKMREKKEGIMRGDFNGDGKLETATLIKPRLSDADMDCDGPCTARITFSDQHIPNIIIENCIGGMPINHGDLNENGTDEIGILPEWFTSCWHAYKVYTLINGKWEYAVKPFSTYCDQWEQGVAPIVKDKAKKGYAIIAYTEANKDYTEFLIKHKSVPVKK